MIVLCFPSDSASSFLSDFASVVDVTFASGAVSESHAEGDADSRIGRSSGHGCCQFLEGVRSSNQATELYCQTPHIFVRLPKYWHSLSPHPGVRIGLF